ncbi:MAG: L,D-transpeptidase family protein [Geminicoccaceae bacterium]
MLLRLVAGSALLCITLHGQPTLADQPTAVPAATAVAPGPAGVEGIYQAAGTSSLWAGAGPAADRRAALAALLARESPVDVTLLKRLGGADGPDRRAADRAMSAAFLDYLTRRGGGVPPTSADVETVLRLLQRPVPAEPLALAQLDLRVVEALGGWVPVDTFRPEPVADASPAELRLVAFVNGAPVEPPAAAKPLPVESSLRARLVQSGDLAPDGAEPVEAGIRRFQDRHGLAPDGVVGAQTLAALNAPVSWQIRQIDLNLARSAQLRGRSSSDRHVVVNVPAYRLEVVDQGRVVLEARVIVGDEETPTPIFDDNIRYIELNPSWYVPPSIVEELQAKEFRKAGYFESNGFEWRGGGETGKPLRLVQRPGATNALGQMKFLFPNHHAVYIHDTAKRGLFGRSERSLSHGCIRVENPMALALALAGDEGWDQARFETALATGKTRRVTLQRPVPVYLDYITAFVDAAGRLQLRQDLYGHDRDGIALFPDKAGAAPPPPSGRPTVPDARPDDDGIEANGPVAPLPEPAQRADAEPAPAALN